MNPVAKQRQPGISLVALVTLFGAYSLVDGILGIWTGIRGRNESADWWVLLLGGLVGIGIGLFTFMAPGVTALALLFYIAIWAIAKGMLEIVTAIRLRKEIEGEGWMLLTGLASVLFGIILMTQPAAGVQALLWLIATYAFIFGFLQVMLSFRVRGLGKQLAHA